MVSVGDTLPFPKVADFLASHSLYEGLPRLNTHRTISVPGCCVVVAIARNSPSTSNVSCRNIDDDESGEGEPFQLRKLENRSFWKNEEVTNEGLKVGCLLEYRVVRRRCELGEGDEEQFIFHRIAGTKLQVSFHYNTNSTVVRDFLRNLHCPSVLEGLEPPPLLIWAPLQNFLFFNFLSIRSYLVFCFLFFCENFTLLHVHSCKQPEFYCIFNTQRAKSR